MAQHTPGPWEYVPADEHHGPYVCGPAGGDICDCYVMSLPSEKSTLNGGPSKPILFFGEMADPNARLIAAAPDLKDACNGLLGLLQLLAARDDIPPAVRHIMLDNHRAEAARAAIDRATDTGEK